MKFDFYYLGSRFSSDKWFIGLNLVIFYFLFFFCKKRTVTYHISLQISNAIFVCFYFRKQNSSENLKDFLKIVFRFYFFTFFLKPPNLFLLYYTYKVVRIFSVALNCFWTRRFLHFREAAHTSIGVFCYFIFKFSDFKWF